MNAEWHSLGIDGVNALERGDRAQARALLKRAVALNPPEAWPYLKLAEVLEESNLKIHLYERSLEVEVTDWAFIGLITIHLQHGRFEAAYRAFCRASSALSDRGRLENLCPQILEVASLLNGSDFKWQQYLKARPRLSTKDRNPADVAIQHYLEVGRLLEQASMSALELPGGFNSDLYKLLHPETADISPEDTYVHFVTNEAHDATLYSLDNIPRDFDPSIYRMLNPDLAHLSERDLLVHYLNTGKAEKRLYNSGLSIKEMRRLSTIDLKAYDQYRNNCVVFINHESTLTGAPLFLNALSEYVAQRGIFQHVVFLDTYATPFFSTKENESGVVRLYHNNDIKRLREIIAFLNPLLIYSNSLNLFLKNIHTFQFIRYRALFHLHEAVDDATRFCDLTAIAADRVYTVSDRLRNDFSKLGLSNVRTFPPFLPGEALSKLDACQAPVKTPKRRAQASTTVTIGMCGAICERKNFELFQYLSVKRPDLQFLWVGGNPEEAEAYSTRNLTVVPFTKNPYEYFKKMDYFFLTSKRDPCPIVVLEALYLNKKVLVLDGNILYDHPHEKLDNYIVIKDHNNDPDTILAKFNTLSLTKTPTATRQNQEYIQQEFSVPRVLIKNSDGERDVIAVSYYVGPTDTQESRMYYINLINQFLLRNDRACEVVIQFASNTTVKEEVKRQFERCIQSPLRMYERPNRGFDIGGLMASVKHLFDEDPKREGYLIYLHTKSNEIWRESLHRIMFFDDYHRYDTVAPEQFTVDCKIDDLNRPTFGRHDLFKPVQQLRDPFPFVAGTTFITRFRNLAYLHEKHDEINSRLTDTNTDDRYWCETMLNEEIFRKYYERHQLSTISTPIDIDGPAIMREKGCKNYFELLTQYNRRGIPDCQFEHALERLIGHLILDGKRVRLV